MRGRHGNGGVGGSRRQIEGDRGRKKRRWTWGPTNSSTRRQSSSRHVTASNLLPSRGGCYATRRVVKIRHGTAAVATAATVGVADPRSEGVRSVPPSFASGVLRARIDQIARCIS